MGGCESNQEIVLFRSCVRACVRSVDWFVGMVVGFLCSAVGLPDLSFCLLFVVCLSLLVFCKRSQPHTILLTDWACENNRVSFPCPSHGAIRQEVFRLGFSRQPNLPPAPPNLRSRLREVVQSV